MVLNRQNDRILTVLQNRQNPVMQSCVKMTLSAGLLPDGFKPSTSASMWRSSSPMVYIHYQILGGLARQAEWFGTCQSPYTVMIPRGINPRGGTNMFPFSSHFRDLPHGWPTRISTVTMWLHQT
jgi:hypothetical protein